ncbi:hypothetical protein OH77DRAFT_267401 [Trametes cingulata]|nr:hypothetical protein OH77DRAFT_267401 [Trametes cingulata]
MSANCRTGTAQRCLPLLSRLVALGVRSLDITRRHGTALKFSPAWRKLNDTLPHPRPSKPCSVARLDKRTNVRRAPWMARASLIVRFSCTETTGELAQTVTVWDMARLYYHAPRKAAVVRSGRVALLSQHGRVLRTNRTAIGLRCCSFLSCSARRSICVFSQPRLCTLLLAVRVVWTRSRCRCCSLVRRRGGNTDRSGGAVSVFSAPKSQVRGWLRVQARLYRRRGRSHDQRSGRRDAPCRRQLSLGERRRSCPARASRSQGSGSTIRLHTASTGRCTSPLKYSGETSGGLRWGNIRMTTLCEDMTQISSLRLAMCSRQ